ncbi:hypothetical protein ACH4VT_30195 [Streptomyces lydicus]
MTNDAPIALPSLAGLHDLQRVYLAGLRPEPADDLPPHVELTLHPRPRS